MLVDQYWRGVVMAPETGDTYYLLKVMQHDKALQYAASHRLSRAKYASEPPSAGGYRCTKCATRMDVTSPITRSHSWACFGRIRNCLRDHPSH